MFFSSRSRTAPRNSRSSFPGSSESSPWPDREAEPGLLAPEDGADGLRQGPLFARAGVHVVGLIEQVPRRQKPVPVAARDDHDRVGRHAPVLGLARLDGRSAAGRRRAATVSRSGSIHRTSTRERRGLVGQQHGAEAGLDGISGAGDGPDLDGLLEPAQRLEGGGAERPAPARRPVPAREVPRRRARSRPRRAPWPRRCPTSSSDLAPAEARAAGLSPPPPRIDRARRDEERQGDHRAVEDQAARVDDAAREARSCAPTATRRRRRRASPCPRGRRTRRRRA